MKKILVLIWVMTLLLPVTARAGGTLPMTLAGISLGKDVNTYSECCDMTLATPIPDAPFLSEVHLTPHFIPGIRGGSLTYGNCAKPGKLVRIKLKFNDRSQDLFERLLKRYKKVYGKPDSYEGDAFRNIIGWKWNFHQGDERVSLLLMWSRDKEMRPGVSIKMSLTSMIDLEYQCFRDDYEAMERSHGGPSVIRHLDDFVAK